MIDFKHVRVRTARNLLLPLSALLLFLSIGAVAVGAAQDSTGADSTVRISKVSFLIHPVCWDLALAEGGRMRPDFLYRSFTYRGGAWYSKQEFYEILEWERRVNRKQKEYIRAMGPDEALIIYPIGNRPAMQSLEKEGLQRLGRRCVIVRSESPSANHKVDYRQLLPDAVKIELLDDLLEAVRHNSDTWNAQALEVIFYNRMIALEIDREFKKRRLEVDPERVEALAFGEGFEQCATTWKAMVGTYLGWSRPIEIDYNLSVSGMPLLRGAKFKERVAVGEEVRMFLWELEDGRPMAWFVRTRGSLAQAQLFVSLPFDLKAFKLFDEFGTQLWPDPVRETQHLGGVHWWWMGSANDSPLRMDFKGPMRVPVSVGLRQLPTDRNIFIVSGGIPFDEFRQALIKSPIGPAPSR
ncbi:MAG: hypothetical protein OXU26_02810 [Acidobacteriota bacterium]|nr:hypothetical protein [Acidobacteriota bacterium]